MTFTEFLNLLKDNDIVYSFNDSFGIEESEMRKFNFSIILKEDVYEIESKWYSNKQ